MTNVGTIIKQFIMWAFGWALTPMGVYVEKTTKDIKILFFHDEDEMVGLDDNQLSMLGLDVEAMNDGKKYWEYSTRENRSGSGARGGRMARLRAGLGM